MHYGHRGDGGQRSMDLSVIQAEHQEEDCGDDRLNDNDDDANDTALAVLYFLRFHK